MIDITLLKTSFPKTLLALLLTTVFAYAKGTTRETGYQNVLEANPNLQEIGNLSIGRNYQRLPTTTTNPKIYFDSNAPNLSAHSIEIKSKILFTIPIAPSG